SIVAVCPHCEARFNLQDELAGKVMRCPNPDCREVFTVPAAAPVPPPPPPEPAPRKKAGTRDIGDVLPVVDARPALGAEPALPSDEVVDAEPVTLPPPPPARPKKRPPEPAVVDAVVVSKPTPAPAVVDAVVVAPPAGVVDAVAVGPPKVREVVWSPNADVPPPPGAREEPDDEPFILPKRRRKKKTNLPVYILIGMASTIVILGGAFALIYLQRTAGAEARSARDAEDQYKAGDYSAAAKAFSELATSYPASDNRPKYEFYSALATLQRDVRSVATRDDPGPAVTKVLAFLDAHKDSPFVKPDDGPGADVLAAGRKVAEDAAGHAEDRVKEYRRDRTKADELRKAAESVARGRELVQRLDPLRAPAAEPFDGLRLRFDQVSRDIDSETRRSQGMAEIRALIEKPTDASVEAARAKLAEYGLTADPEAARLVADAGGMLGRLVRYVPAPAAPTKPPGGYAGALAFAAPVGPTVPAGDAKPGVFLAVGRGLVYAFDDETGAFLWAARVGAGVNEPPAIATVDSPAGPAAVAVVVSHVGGTAAVAGHDLRTGAVRWYQPLPAVPAGPAVVVGPRAYAAVRDADGTLVEIDVTNGAKLGQVTLGQPLGPPPVLRPGTGLIYLVADARRVYVLDAANRDVEGNRLPPRCAQVLLTGHAPGSVRTAPLVLGPAGDTPADRWLVTAHATTPGETQLRAFPLPPLTPPTADGLAPPGMSVAAAAGVSVPGWVWLPPATDGERLGLASDAGEFRLFGVNQPGNRDPALFPIPQAGGASRSDMEPVPGLAFPADDAAFWVLAGGGEVQRVRVGLDPAKGLVATPVARPRQPGRSPPVAHALFVEQGVEGRVRAQEPVGD
ncbi:MAG: PQQ-binding-like beta-propeller repeat protein, partial [Gemmataceae bacterium]|nr:PQQ-binding-like beta-propeller repeat protein [Gemmataceae bacterium]